MINLTWKNLFPVVQTISLLQSQDVVLVRMMSSFEKFSTVKQHLDFWERKSQNKKKFNYRL